MSAMLQGRPALQWRSEASMHQNVQLMCSQNRLFLKPWLAMLQ